MRVILLPRLALGCAIAAALLMLPGHTAADTTANITCDSLHVSLSSDKKFYVFTVLASGDSGNITGYTFNYGDRQSYHFTFGGVPASTDRHTASVTHAYQTAGSYTASAQVNLKTPSKAPAITSAACKTSITIGKPRVLPRAGASIPFGISAAGAAIAVCISFIHQRRRAIIRAHP
jgi:hypothetical protein